MFDIGFWELSLIAVIGLLILGPERLPRVARTAGLWVGKLKKMVADVKSNIDEELRMEELNALKQTGEKLKNDLESTQKDLREAGNAFQSSVEDVSDAADSITKDADVDIVSAINESAPKIDEELVGVGGTAKPGKSKTGKKAKKKNVKKKAANDGKKVTKKKPASKKSVARGKNKSTKKNKEFAPEEKGYKAQVQATSSHSSDLPNQDTPDHNV